VSFVPNVAAAFLVPLSGNPYSAMVGRTTVFAVYPDIFMPIVAVIARNPNITFAGGWDDFDRTRWRWTDADYNLCAGCTNREEECAGCGEKLFLHKRRSPEYCFSL
jgi:hypothetical protein